MHAEISGTADYREPDDHACLRRLRSLIDLLPVPPGPRSDNGVAPSRDPQEINSIVPVRLPADSATKGAQESTEYDIRDVLSCLIDADSMQEFRADYGTTLVTAFCRIGGRPVGIVANQGKRCKSATGELQIGGVLYTDSAEKGARFVMQCNQAALPLVFLQNVQGFMVGRQSEQAGIIRSGAKLVNVVSNSVVPKLTVIIGGSFGAGNYALCGKAYDPWLILAWPGSRYAVMGADQAAETLLSLRVRESERSGQTLSEQDRNSLRDEIRQQYIQQTDIRYGAARGWVDAIIAPSTTRDWLSSALSLIPEGTTRGEFRTGLLQM
jgi:acetyl-CoA carboxylase carboxyltransferase component